MTGAKPLSRTINSRKGLLRGNRPVPTGNRCTAIVTVGARRVVGLPKIAEQDLAAARHCLTIADQRFDLLSLDLALTVCYFAAVEQPKQVHQIGDAVSHPCVRRQSVAPGAPPLLVVGFE